VVYSFCATPNNLGVPVSSWGTLEYNRVGLTVYRYIHMYIVPLTIQFKFGNMYYLFNIGHFALES
jgi:hypothetical protein